LQVLPFFAQAGLPMEYSLGVQVVLIVHVEECPEHSKCSHSQVHRAGSSTARARQAPGAPVAAGGGASL